MENLLKVIKAGDIESSFHYFKMLFSYPYWNYVREAIRYTRHYEEGLMFIEHLRNLLNCYKHLLTTKEFEEIDRDLIYFNLELLDRSDRWMRFIEYFDQVRLEKHYTFTYSLDIGDSHGDPPFNGFLVNSDENFHYVHFLYMWKDRYEVIQRKIQRLKLGKSVDHLKHHPQSELSDEEIARRFEKIFRLADEAIKHTKR